MLKDEEIPVFLINGFLEGGKTSFISYTLSEDYFHIEGKTLLIVCEEGETDYNTLVLLREKTTRINAGSKEDMSLERLKEADRTYKPDRVIIEYNGMWGDPGELEFPETWVLYQQLTCMDGSTLGSYLANMKPLMGPMLKNSELCIVNRCDGIDEAVLLDYKRKLRPMLLNGSTVVMENKYGEIRLETLDEELPFDVKANPIVIGDDDYGIWFIDAKDYPQRYMGKDIQFTAQIMKTGGLSTDEFVPARLVMTCCEADIQPFGYIASYKGIGAFSSGDWVKLKARFSVAYKEQYHGEGPYLKVLEMVRTGPVERAAGF